MYITRNNRKNDWSVAGHISKTFIKTGQYGPFGMFIVAIDDGYYSKKEQTFIERTQFVSVDVGKMKDLPALTVGDYIDIDGKFEIEQWEDKQSQKMRSEIKLKAMQLNVHIPAGICKMLKDQGYVKPPQQGAKAPQQQSGQNSASAPRGNQNQPSGQWNGYNQAPQSNGHQNQAPEQWGGPDQSPPPHGSTNRPSQQQRGGYSNQRG